MMYHKVIKGRDVFVAVAEVMVQAAVGENYVGGHFTAAYRLDEPPGYFITGTYVRGDDKRARLFPTAAQAATAGFQAALESLP